MLFAQVSAPTNWQELVWPLLAAVLGWLLRHYHIIGKGKTPTPAPGPEPTPAGPVTMIDELWAKVDKLVHHKQDEATTKLAASILGTPPGEPGRNPPSPLP